jgi:AcrR family transcriptional regulator
MRRTRDAAATRRRILQAATADFARYGIAGARVDRIAAEANVNKAQIYAYFGDKMSLFTAIFRQHAVAVVNATPFTPEDLPSYAVGLYDAALERPDLIRLLVWARLENVDLPLDDDGLNDKLRLIAEAQASGSINPDISPEDVLALLTSTALTWSEAGWSPVAPAGSPTDHDRRRTILRHVIARSLAA